MPVSGNDMRREVLDDLAVGRVSGSRLLRILDDLPDLIAYVDATGHNRFVNQAAARWFGRSPAECFGVPIEELLGTERWEATRETIDAVLAGEPQTIRRSLVLPDDTVAYTLMRYLPVWVDGVVVGFDVLGTDITERVAAEEAALELASANAVMADRARIAVDLHDLTIQLLYGAALDADAVARDQADPDPRLERAAQGIDQAIRELRTSIYKLSRNLGPDPVVAGVVRIVTNAANWLGFTPEVVYDGDLDHLPTPLVDALLAVLREAVSNMVRHAEARHATVEVHVTEGVLTLRVTDDGRGPGTTNRRSGVANMETRAAELGGTCAIEPAEGGGTQVTWTAPVPVPADDAG